MHDPLVPCAGCRRHVRATEHACPFCDAVLAAPAAGVHRDVPRGLPRAAVFALGASLALNACASTTVGRGDAADTVTADEGGSSPDVAVVDASDGTAPMDVVADEGGIVAMYGGPPPFDVTETDAGESDVTETDATDVVSEDSGIFPLYGAPPLPDGWDR